MSFGKFLGDSSSGKKTDTAATTVFNGQPRSSTETIIGHGTKIVGRLDFTNPAEIHGEGEGEITSQSRLILGEQSRFHGTIDGVEVVIQGRFEGEIHASARLILKRPCILKGNIFTASLSIEEGVSFEGGCVMTQESNKENRVNSGLKSAKPQIVAHKQTGVAA